VHPDPACDPFDSWSVQVSQRFHTGKRR
jgi:hypothetical protein